MLHRAISVLTLCFLLTTLSTLSTARQVRISRYNVQIEEDSTGATLVVDEEPEINATVREVTPYPAAGYRPGHSFNLPNEQTTTLNNIELDTTTLSNGIETTTFATATSDVDADIDDRDVDGVVAKQTFTGYAPRGYQPRVAFNLPTEVVEKSSCNVSETSAMEKLDATVEKKVNSYPAAGYRPCAPFTLPNEVSGEGMLHTNTSPACGVSLNPLAPKPPAGSVDEPDAERVPVATNTGNGNTNVAIVASDTNPTIISAATLRGPQQIIWRQPLTMLPQRPFVYTAHLQTW